MCQIMLTDSERESALKGLEFICAKSERGMISIAESKKSSIRKALGVLKDVVMFMNGVDKAFLELAKDQVNFEGKPIIVGKNVNNELYKVHSWVLDDSLYGNVEDEIDEIILFTRMLEDNYGLTLNLRAFRDLY